MGALLWQGVNCSHHWGKNVPSYSTDVPWSLRFFGLACENRALGPLTFRVVIFWPWVVSSRAHPEQCSPHRQGEPFACLWTFCVRNSLLHSILWTPAALVLSPTLNSGSLPFPVLRPGHGLKSVRGFIMNFISFDFYSSGNVTWHLASWERFVPTLSLFRLMRGNSQNMS